ncbi:hypothetical protein RCIX865 [Methanocella arvoryzae MRE50]|uniref:Uncharacterized protein n=1 Tax=Methanocella arvoryzae (strain DSM 22066 / NBRC 105507 / MRE50) TaxID=351160 RepID=Q0W5W8_METAR|nr:hypothetical protein RCIX865 [Methanocella arvoryzae MRE50]
MHSVVIGALCASVVNNRRAVVVPSAQPCNKIRSYRLFCWGPAIIFPSSCWRTPMTYGAARASIWETMLPPPPPSCTVMLCLAGTSLTTTLGVSILIILKATIPVPTAAAVVMNGWSLIVLVAGLMRSCGALATVVFSLPKDWPISASVRRMSSSVTLCFATLHHLRGTGCLQDRHSGEQEVCDDCCQHNRYDSDDEERCPERYQRGDEEDGSGHEGQRSCDQQGGQHGNVDQLPDQEVERVEDIVL